jgi:mannosyltransferase PIG-V
LCHLAGIQALLNSLMASAPSLSALRIHPTSRAAAGLVRAAPPAAVGAAFVALYVGCAALFSTPAVPPGSEGYGYVGSTSLHGLMRWDGAWYAGVAQNGYQAADGRYQSYAFFPLFPALAGGLRAAVPLLSLPAAGVIVNSSAVVLAALFLNSCLSALPPARRLLVIAAVLAVPSAFFDVAFYSEGLFLLASAMVLWAVSQPSRLTWAPLGVLLASLDRPLGFLLVILVVAALWKDRRPRAERVALGVASLLCACAFLGVYWRVTGNPLAFASAQSGWTSLRTLGPGGALQWIGFQLNPLTSTNPVILFSYWELLVVAVPLLFLIRRDQPVALYAAAALAAGFVLGGVGTQSRYIAALLPLWVGVLLLLHRRAGRLWVPLVSVAVAAGVSCNLWLLSRFAAGVWAG